MRDLFDEGKRAKLVVFGERFLAAIEDGVPMPRSYAPLSWRDFAYSPGQAAARVNVNGQKVVLLTDAEPHQTNLLAMIERFRDSFAGGVETFNFHDLDIKGSCLGCLRCGYNFAFMISGPLGQNGNLRQILEAWVELQQSNLAGYVSDEFGDSAQIDALLQDLAGRLVEFAEAGYVRPQTFLGVGGLKVFRDDIYGRLRTVFQADHRAYKRMGIYDFPQRELRVRALNALTTVLFKVPRVRKAFSARIEQGMVQPYQKVLEA
jgi:hypothetical protein